MSESIHESEDSIYKCRPYPDSTGWGIGEAYITAVSPEHAAERFHEVFNSDGFSGSTITVAVIDPDGNETIWNTRAEHQILYYASPVENL